MIYTLQWLSLWHLLEWVGGAAGWTPVMSCTNIIRTNYLSRPACYTCPVCGVVYIDDMFQSVLRQPLPITITDDACWFVTSTHMRTHMRRQRVITRPAVRWRGARCAWWDYSQRDKWLADRRARRCTWPIVCVCVCVCVRRVCDYVTYAYKHQH